MILSVSRRTDIPNYYSEWFMNRIRDGYLYVRNPMNPHQISQINLSPDVVDCIVFWTKNPEKMIDRLGELQGYSYYFQFTLTGYGRDIEPGLPDKRTRLLPTFKRLSEIAGKERVIWRYDPILINERYTEAYHLKAFAEIADNLSGYTEKVVISFMDFYAKTRRNTKGLNIREVNGQEMLDMAGKLAQIANRNGLKIESCAEEIDLSSVGISHGSCIDKDLLERIVGCRLKAGKDRNQRGVCGCVESVDVGTYNTCRNGCRYCYANFSEEKVREHIAGYNVNSPLLCGIVEDSDKITVRKAESLKIEQISLFESLQSR